MEERLFAFVASACVLFWLLSREGRIPRRTRTWLERLAFAVLALGLVYAFMLSVESFIGG